MSSDKCPYEYCDGSGMVLLKNYYPEKGEPMEFMRKCKCYEEVEMKSMLKKAKVPLEFTNITLRSFETNIYGDKEKNEMAALAKRITTNYIKDFPRYFKDGKGLYIVSEKKGSGKTRLASSVLNAILRVYMDRNYSAYYVSSSELIDSIKSTFDSNSKINTSDLMATVKNADILVLDDFGVEKVTDFVEERMTNILDYRMTNKKVTIFTSNIEIEDLDDKYNAGRVSTRVKKMTVTVKMPNKDIRTDKATEEEDELLKELMR